ncbi:MAG: hypothetical protein ACE5I7_11565 [Candidatus Binatia bacterium]
MWLKSVQGRSRREAVASWLALMAPGMLLTRGTIVLALLAAPSLMPWVPVTFTVRLVAAVLLLMHLGSTASLVRHPRAWPLAATFLGLVTLDALLCGALLGADPQLHSPALPLGLAVLALGLTAGGWLAATACLGAAGIGAIAAVWWGMSPALFVPLTFSFQTILAVDNHFGGAVVGSLGLSFPTTLGVDTLFGGVPAAVTAGNSFRTVLSVDTFFAGSPAGSGLEILFTPALAVALTALCTGMGLNLWRARQARTAVVPSMLPAK